MTRGLTDMQERALLQYYVLGDGKRAGIKAGYSPKTAAVKVCNLLKKPVAISFLNQLKAKERERAVLDRDAVLAEIHKSVHRDLRGLEDDDGWFHGHLRDIPRELLDVVNGFEVEQMFGLDGAGVRVIIGQRIKMKIVPKEKAIDMAMRHLGAYAPDKVESKVEAKMGIDWDSLYGRGEVVDPVDDAVKRIGDES